MTFVRPSRCRPATHLDDDLDADDEDDTGPSPAADDAAVVPGTDDVAGEGDEIRHPERKAASEEAKRYRLRLKEERSSERQPKHASPNSRTTTH